MSIVRLQIDEPRSRLAEIHPTAGLEEDFFDPPDLLEGWNSHFHFVKWVESGRLFDTSSDRKLYLQIEENDDRVLLFFSFISTWDGTKRKGLYGAAEVKERWDEEKWLNILREEATENLLRKSNRAVFWGRESSLLQFSRSGILVNSPPDDTSSLKVTLLSSNDGDFYSLYSRHRGHVWELTRTGTLLRSPRIVLPERYQTDTEFRFDQLSDLISTSNKLDLPSEIRHALLIEAI